MACTKNTRRGCVTDNVMGGTVSSGETNEELVDNLVSANYITKTVVERVFRCVDRGNYFPETANTAEKLAYRDVAWKMGLIHISAPCIYCEVMENIDLQPGQSFLNLGSGTGYLSTMAGLLLGANGVNHGVEIFEDVVEYARQRLAEFMSKPGALDEFEFCPPKFRCGNALLLPAGTQYDRVYCGAACTEGEQLDYLTSLIKVGGILIAPVNSELMLIKRIADNELTTKVLLPVSFASLLPAVAPYTTQPTLPRSNPLGLDEVCRFAVRAILRQNIVKEHPELIDCAARRATRKRIRQKRKTRSVDSDDEDILTPEFRTHIARLKCDSGYAEDQDEIISIWSSNSDWSDSESESDSGSNMSDKAEDKSDHDKPECSKSEHDKPESSQSELVIAEPTFSDYMRDKIKALELPKPLIQFLNFGQVI